MLGRANYEAIEEIPFLLISAEKLIDENMAKGCFTLISLMLFFWYELAGRFVVNTSHLTLHISLPSVNLNSSFGKSIKFPFYQL